MLTGKISVLSRKIFKMSMEETIALSKQSIEIQKATSEIFSHATSSNLLSVFQTLHKFK